MLSKLPTQLQERWNRKNFYLRKIGKEAALEEFIEFMDEEISLVSDPMFSSEAIHRMGRETPKSYQHTMRNTKNFNTTCNESKTCLRCSKNHHIDNCEEFMNETVESRNQFFFVHKRLCFGCGNPIHAKHRARVGIN